MTKELQKVREALNNATKVIEFYQQEATKSLNGEAMMDSVLSQELNEQALAELEEFMEGDKQVTYIQAKSLGFTGINRWEQGLDHHKKSVDLFKFLEQHDLRDYGDSFCWKSGGDGDNGETLMYQLDAYFEAQAAIKVIRGDD